MRMDSSSGKSTRSRRAICSGLQAVDHLCPGDEACSALRPARGTWSRVRAGRRARVSRVCPRPRRAPHRCGAGVLGEQQVPPSGSRRKSCGSGHGGPLRRREVSGTVGRKGGPEFGRHVQAGAAARRDRRGGGDRGMRWDDRSEAHPAERRPHHEGQRLPGVPRRHRVSPGPASRTRATRVEPQIVTGTPKGAAIGAAAGAADRTPPGARESVVSLPGRGTLNLSPTDLVLQRPAVRGSSAPDCRSRACPRRAGAGRSYRVLLRAGRALPAHGSRRGVSRSGRSSRWGGGRGVPSGGGRRRERRRSSGRWRS